MMGEIPIIFLVFILIWVAVIVCCRSFSSEDLFINERARRREIILSQQRALRQCHLPIVRQDRNLGSPSPDIRVTPIRVTTISRGGNIALDFYEIQIPPSRPHGGTAVERQNQSRPFRNASPPPAPPPSFSMAYYVSSPVYHPDDLPPPSYEESVKARSPPEQKTTKDTEMHI